MLVINKSDKSFVLQRDLWRGTRGNRRHLGTRRVLLGHASIMTVKQARDAAIAATSRMLAGEEPNAAQQTGGVTLRQALSSFLDWQARKNRRPRTIEHNRYTVERYLADWLNTSLMDIGEDRQAVRDRHLQITKQDGPACANHALKCLRAIYNRERRANPRLPECPVFSEDLNAEKKRTQFVSVEALPHWRKKVEAIKNPVRRSLHFFDFQRDATSCGVRGEMARL
jgi:hypothetical protein